VKCRVCRDRAVIQVRRHNANFCADHLIEHVRRQVERTIHHHRMFGPDDRLLLGVSGGKDSLALWDVLDHLGHRVDGVYLDLGIGRGYSNESLELSRAYAAQNGLSLQVVDLSESVGFTIPEAAAVSARAPCSACGLSKRYLLNDLAREGGYDVLVTGHNLDDEAATLFGNVMRWDTEYLARQSPVLPADGGLVRKVKPLVRVAERETAAYAVVRGIDYEVEECPMAAGNTVNRYKEWLNKLEEESPGIKATFLFGFLERGQAAFEGSGETPALGECRVCGQPTTGETCAFCRLQHQTTVRISSRAGS
jgi:tRNA-5-methyluridine54 2-sulfurtransferase